MKRVAIDLRILHYARTGFFRYAQGLLAALADADLDFQPLLIHVPGQDLSELNPGAWDGIAAEIPLFTDQEAPALRALLEGHSIDAIHFPFSLFPGRVAPRVMLTIHDLSAVRWPETIEAAYRPHYEQALTRAAEAELVLFDSESVRREYEELRPLNRALVAPPYTPFEGHGIGRIDRPPSSPMPPFILVVGSLEPRKNPLLALRGWEHLRTGAADGPAIVFVASHQWLTDDFRAAIDRSPWKQDIQLRTHVDDAELVSLLAGCVALLSVSRYEGFGLTVVEGAWAGAPVISTPVPALSEAGVAPDALLPSEPTPEVVAARLDAIINDPDLAAAHATAMRTALAAHYRSLDAGRLPAAYQALLSSQPGLAR